MLHEFLNANRTELIARCLSKVALRRGSHATPKKTEYGVPVFLGQLIEALRIEVARDAVESDAVPGNPGVVSAGMAAAATKHGRELLRHGYSIDEVVHDYGDLCQAVTELAYEENAFVSVSEFHTLNRCLDDAIAGAVTEFSRAPPARVRKEEVAASESPGFPAHDMRDFLHAAFLAFGAIKSGIVSPDGATGAILDRSLVGLRDLIDGSLREERRNHPTPVDATALSRRDH